VRLLGVANVVVEIAVPSGTTTTERGRLLERFSAEFLETQNYEVVERVRLTGVEVDLIAKDRATGERVFVECKGHRQNIPADVITKLHGAVDIHGFHSGWLISTAPLSQDAKGLQDLWEQRPAEIRRRLRIYPPERLTQHLTHARLIIDPGKIQTPPGLRYSGEAYLLLTPYGRYWALPVLDEQTAVPGSVLLFEAASGEPISEEQRVLQISQTDTTLAGLEWTTPPTAPDAITTSNKLSEELQSIVRIPCSDHWADYRPARPADFVGRDNLLNDVFVFLDTVRDRATKTRIMALKAPSGWGKSSAILKIAANASSRRLRSRHFVCGVDCRAASSKRYPELAILSAIREAIECNFISFADDTIIGGGSNPFSTDSMRSLLDQLAADNKVICVIFDQFEELLYKEELSAVFEEFYRLCHSVDELQENVVIGFSWKTDGTIPTEHSAYHLWHGLADRRIEFELRPFTGSDIAKALNRFSTELGERLAPPLRRVLTDHCQGYPWLLKKLCIHILDLVESGMAQSEIIGRSLSIEELFKRDVETLNEREMACLKKIATDTPAEYFRIVEWFGDEVVRTLMYKRLVVRSGQRLSLYWDIFRDYVLTERVPQITMSYIPQANFRKYVAGLRFLMQSSGATFGQLGAELGMSKGAVDNLVRDYVAVGHCEADRPREQVRISCEDNREATEKLLRFCRSHVLYRTLLFEYGTGRPVDEDVVVRLMKQRYREATYADKTWHIYATKMMRWFVGMRLAEQHGRYWILRAETPLTEIPGEQELHRRPRSDIFLGEAPPEKVASLLDALKKGLRDRAALEATFGRNALLVARKLGLVVIDPDDSVRLQSVARSDFQKALREAIASSSTVSMVNRLKSTSPGLSGEAVGEKLAQEFSLRWSTASKRRTGNALARWAEWLQDRQQSLPV
jgi:Restriction endonuclease